MFRGERDLGFPECNWSDANKKVFTGFGWESTNTHTSVQVIFTTNNAIPAMTIATKYFSHNYDVLGSSIHQKYYAWDLILQYAFHLECRYSLLVDLL